MSKRYRHIKEYKAKGNYKQPDLFVHCFFENALIKELLPDTYEQFTEDDSEGLFTCTNSDLFEPNLTEKEIFHACDEKQVAKFLIIRYLTPHAMSGRIPFSIN